MSYNLPPGHQQAIEACIGDAVSFMVMFQNIQKHPKAPLIFNGLIAHASMFVFESYRCINTLFPDAQDSFLSVHAELLHKSRHRAKLLDNTKKSIEEVTAELADIAKRQHNIFFAPHIGILGSLKRALQPDMGLSIYNNHIFTTTHSTIFEFGETCDFEKCAYAFGNAIGVYIATLLTLFQIEIPPSVELGRLPGNIEMRDIKYITLYNRGQLNAKNMDSSAGLILILANLNFVIYILSGLLPRENHALFRMKFVTAFHANSGIKSIHDQLMLDKSMSYEVKNFFREALGNKDSRWLRRRRRLRNLLTHYLPDEKMISELSEKATRIDAIEHCGGGLSFEEINTLLDRNIAHLSGLLEKSYKLTGDPFWLGKVK